MQLVLPISRSPTLSLSPSFSLSVWYISPLFCLFFFKKFVEQSETRIRSVHVQSLVHIVIYIYMSLYGVYYTHNMDKRIRNKEKGSWRNFVCVCISQRFFNVENFAFGFGLDRISLYIYYTYLMYMWCMCCACDYIICVCVFAMCIIAYLPTCTILYRCVCHALLMLFTALLLH